MRVDRGPHQRAMFYANMRQQSTPTKNTHNFELLLWLATVCKMILMRVEDGILLGLSYEQEKLVKSVHSEATDDKNVVFKGLFFVVFLFFLGVDEVF